MHYYGTRLSENISRREPEGYLLCLNVPVARTGTQEYLPAEIGLPGGGEPVPVFRPPEEVFSPEAVASFEGMPVTNDHPPEGVDISNIRALQKGHAHNVRQGSGENADLLLADLIITDPALINAILEDGKREISCGYTYELHEENGQYIQRKIRGNHVAVVDAGRAGSRVSIKDRQPPVPGHGTRLSQHQSERRKDTMNKSLCKVLARMAKDGDVETVAEMIEEMIAPGDPEQAVPEPEPEAEPAEETVETGETKNIIIDGDVLAGLLERLDRIIALLAPAAEDENVPREFEEALKADGEEPDEQLSGELAAAIEELLEQDDPVLPEFEDENDEVSRIVEEQHTGDAFRAALAAVRPVLDRLPGKLRRRVIAAIAARVRNSGRRGTVDSGVYTALVSAGRRMAPASAELGKRIMEKRNAALRKRS